MEPPRQILLDEPFLSFIEHSEVYCSGACCGVDAFEVHEGLILRKVIDWNLIDKSGNDKYSEARNQVSSICDFLSNNDLLSINEEVPIWCIKNNGLPKFWLPIEEVNSWFLMWMDKFEKASHHGGLSNSKKR